MLKLNADALIGALTILSDMNDIASKDPKWVYGDENRRAWIVMNLDKLIGQLQILDLRLATKKAESIKAYIRQPHVPEQIDALSKLVSTSFKELRERIEQELEVRSIYYIDDKKSSYLAVGETPFGKDVSDKFPNAATDISEAANCLGLSRNTAAVFHLMRAMEEAVRRLGEKLGATIIDKNNIELEWGIIISNMKSPIEKMAKGNERNAWSETISLLYHVKQKWRNGTMHPKETYSDDEAVSVYESVKSFMVHLAPLI